MNDPIFEIIEEKKEANYAKIAITPLHKGYGDTLGTSLRRVMLSSLTGAAATSVKITGVKHQFSTLKGMKEDIVDFVLNLKKVRFAYEGDKPSTATLSVEKDGVVKASDIETESVVKVVNPDLVLATLNKGAKLSAKIEIETGVGYSSADDRQVEEIGVIPLDASFSPVVRVNYKVEETRVGRTTNFDKLILEIWTDGTVDPQGALVKSSKILVSYYKQIIAPREVAEEVKEEKDSLGPVGKLSVEEIGLPTRVANALIKSGNETVEQLVTAKRSDLVRVRNLGEKSVRIVEAALGEKGLSLK